MYLVAIAWGFVVLLMALVEATSTQGTVLGALITFVFYGVLPLSIVMYLLGAPSRNRARKQRESAERPIESPIEQTDRSDHAAALPTEPLATERKEP